VVEELLRAYPAGAGFANAHGEYPLHLAVRAGEVQVVNCLLDAAPHAAKQRGPAGFLPLHTAVAKNAALPVITALLRSYPDATLEASEEGDLPLHVAAAGNVGSEVGSVLIVWVKEVPRGGGCESESE